jgi:hypothetical protein
MEAAECDNIRMLQSPTISCTQMENPLGCVANGYGHIR